MYNDLHVTHGSYYDQELYPILHCVTNVIVGASFVRLDCYPQIKRAALQFIDNNIYWTLQATRWKGDIAPRDFDTREHRDSVQRVNSRTPHPEIEEWVRSNGVEQCYLTVRCKNGLAIATTQPQNGGLDTIAALEERLRDLFLEWYEPKEAQSALELIEYCICQLDFNPSMLKNTISAGLLSKEHLKKVIDNPRGVVSLNTINKMIACCSYDEGVGNLYRPVSEPNPNWNILQRLTNSQQYGLSIHVGDLCEPVAVCEYGVFNYIYRRDKVAEALLNNPGFNVLITDKYNNVIVDYKTYADTLGVQSFYGIRLRWMIECDKTLPEAFVEAANALYGL